MKAAKLRPKSSTGKLSLVLKRIFFKHNSTLNALDTGTIYVALLY